MSNFKKLSEAMQFSPEKMKKNGVFETDRFFCDTYCFEPGQEQSPHTHGGQDKIYYVLEGQGSCSRWGMSNASSGPVRSCSRRLDRITASPTVARKNS